MDRSQLYSTDSCGMTRNDVENNSEATETAASTIRALEEQLASGQERLKQESAERAKLARRVEELSRQSAYWQAELKLREQGVRYRLGDVLVRAARPSLDTLLLPARLTGLLMDGLRNRSIRRRQSRVVAAASTASVSAAPEASPFVEYPAFLICCVDEAGFEHHTRGCAIARRLKSISPKSPIHMLSFEGAYKHRRPEGIELHELARPPRAWQGRSAEKWGERLVGQICKIARLLQAATLIYDGPPSHLVALEPGRPEELHCIAAVVTAHTPPALLRDWTKVLKEDDQLIVAGEVGFNIALDEWAPDELKHVTARLVEPVVCPEPEDFEPREQVRKQWDLTTSQVLVCIRPPATDAEAWTRRVLEAAPARDELKIVIAESAGAGRRGRFTLGATDLPRCSKLDDWHAADLLIAAPEYGVVHEAVRFGVPTLLILNPNDEEGMARARFAHRALAAMALLRPAFLDQTIRLALLPSIRASLKKNATRLCANDGAEAAAQYLVAVASLTLSPQPGG